MKWQSGKSLFSRTYSLPLKQNHPLWTERPWRAKSHKDEWRQERREEYEPVLWKGRWRDSCRLYQHPRSFPLSPHPQSWQEELKIREVWGKRGSFPKVPLIHFNRWKQRKYSRPHPNSKQVVAANREEIKTFQKSELTTKNTDKVEWKFWTISSKKKVFEINP